ncbi:MAG: TolC family outer membrane protein [Pseudomonadota bacterium]
MSRINRAVFRVKSLCYSAAAALAVFGAPAALHSETLTETLADTYRNSGLIERNRAVLRAADEDVAQAVAALRPTLSYALRNTYSDGPGQTLATGLSSIFSLSSDLTVYDFGRNRLAVEAQKETVLATRQFLLSVEASALAAAVEAFFDVIEGLETVSLRTSNVQLIQEELRAAQDRFDVGEVTRTDVALAESRLAEAQAQLASARGEVSVAVASFQEAVGRQPGPLVRPNSLPALPASVGDAKAIARRTNASILQVRNQISAAEINLERARRALNPTVTGGFSSSFNVSEGANSARSSQLTLNITGPITQGGQLNSLIRQSRASVDQSRADLLLEQLSVDQQVETAYAQLNTARANIVATREQIRAADVAFQGTREEAQLGARTTLDVLDAEQELLDARNANISAVIAEFRAAYGVLQAIGRLTAQDLGLPVQLYDPAGYYRLVETAPSSLTVSPQGEALDRILESVGRN